MGLAGIRRHPLPWLIAAVGVLVVVALNVYAARHAIFPIYWDDEAGYLSNAFVLSGGSAPDLGGQSYYLGWSLVLTPIWWITHDPGTAYRIAIGITVATGVALVAPLALIAHRLGVRAPTAVLLGAVVAAAPARVLMSNYVLAENFLTLAVAFTVWAALRFQARPTIGRAALFGALSALVFLTHARATPILVATVLWLLLGLRRRVVVSLVGIAAAIIPSAVGFLVYRSISAEMYPGAADREGVGISRLVHPDPAAVLMSLSGQAWYAGVAWLGLPVLGLIVLAPFIVRELRRRRLSLGAWLAVCLIGVVVISVTFIADPIARGVPRIDLLSYGRYLDPFTVPLALFGLVVLVRFATRRRVLISIGIVAVLGAIQVWVLQPTLTNEPGRWWAPVTNAGLLQYPWPNVTTATHPPFLIATVAAVIVLVVVLLFIRFPRLVAVGLISAFAVSSIVAEVRTIHPFFDHFYASDFTIRNVVQEYRGDGISFDLSGLGNQHAVGEADTVSRNAWQYWLIGTDVPVFRSADADPTTALVISRRDWPRAASLGARLVKADTGDLDNALWVMPGALQRSLTPRGCFPAEHSR